MLKVTTSITINQPIKKVWKYTVFPDNAPLWYKNIKSIEWKSKKPLKKGSRLAFSADFAGRTLSYTYEVKELNQKRLVMATDKPFDMETIYEFKALSKNKTEVALTNHGYPAGFSKLFSPLLGIAMKKANRSDLAKLKTILES